MIHIVIHKDNAVHYKHIDDSPEPFFPEPQGTEGDDWVEINIEDEDSCDANYVSQTYNININHIIDVVGE